MKLRAFAGICVVAALSAWAASPARAGLLVGSHDTGRILHFDEKTGAFLGEFGSVPNPHGFAFGPDGDLYATGHIDSWGGRSVFYRFDGETAEYQGQFLGISEGGLYFSSDLLFAPDGDILVAGIDSNNVIRYDRGTSAVVMKYSGGGIDSPASIAIGPDGVLYVASIGNSSISRFDLETGAALGTFVTSGLGGLTNIGDMLFMADGSLLISSPNTRAVLRYGADGAFLGQFIAPGSGGLSRPIGLVFGPDGSLYVADAENDRVVRYDGTTGAFLGVVVTPGLGGLDYPHFLAFTPSASPVPEPSSMVLAAAGTLALLVARLKPRPRARA